MKITYYHDIPDGEGTLHTTKNCKCKPSLGYYHPGHMERIKVHNSLLHPNKKKVKRSVHACAQ